MARIALTDAERQARRKKLLAAAHRCYRRHKTLPTVADIAAEAGLAKGTVYLYFATKEELLIALLEDDFSQLLNSLQMMVGFLPRQPAIAAKRFAKSYTEKVLSLPDLWPLAAISNGVLEKNLPLEAMTGFKLRLAYALFINGQLLEDYYPHLLGGGGASLLLRTYALTLGLWQSLEYPPAFQQTLAQPEFKLLRKDFGTELEQAVYCFWLGSLTSPHEFP